MTRKYYAVKKGRHPGIYLTWPACQREVVGFSGAIYRSFTDENEAKAWLKTNQQPGPRKVSEQLTLDLGSQQPQPSQFSANVIKLFTDGGSRNHGNKRGQHVRKDDKAAWAYLIRVGDKKITGTGGEWGATNNRMEIMALINALQKLIENQWQEQAIIATLDSHYVLDPITKGWLYGWRRRGWTTSTGKTVANMELWQELLRLLPQFRNLQFQWTKGHADNLGNNIVDELLNKTMDEMGDKNENWN